MQYLINLDCMTFGSKLNWYTKLILVVWLLVAVQSLFDTIFAEELWWYPLLWYFILEIRECLSFCTSREPVWSDRHDCWCWLDLDNLLFLLIIIYIFHNCSLEILFYFRKSYLWSKSLILGVYYIWIYMRVRWKYHPNYVWFLYQENYLMHKTFHISCYNPMT